MWRTSWPGIFIFQIFDEKFRLRAFAGTGSADEDEGLGFHAR